MVESQPSKLLVAGSIPVSRSRLRNVEEQKVTEWFEQAAIAVQDEKGYAELHALIDAAFDSRDVEVFLNRVNRSSCGFAISRGCCSAGCWARKLSRSTRRCRFQIRA